jgi:hypothetical protein
MSTPLVTRLRNIAAAKSRPIDRVACIETEAADALDQVIAFWLSDADPRECSGTIEQVVGRIGGLSSSDERGTK